MKSTIFNLKTFVLIAFTGLFAVSCGNRNESDASTEPKVQVEMAVAQLKDYPAVISFSGKLEADKQSNLSTRVMGQIDRIYVKPGQKVKKGDLLIQIRNQDILAKKAQVEASKLEAQSAFENAEKDLKRFEALHASNSASDKEMDDIRTHYKMARARLAAVAEMEKEVEETMRYASIRAPYSGIVTSKFVHEGDMANPGMPLLSLESPSEWNVVARVPEAEIAQVQINESVKVKLNALDVELSGQIVEVNPSSTNSGNQYEAKILLDSEDENTSKLYSGMYATVFYEKGIQKMILVPQESLVHRGQLVGLYAVSQTGNSLLRWVKTGNTYGEKIEILSGLADGEKYIVSSESKLFDGALVAAK